MDKQKFEQEIKPFFFVEHEKSASVCLTVGDYKSALFLSREDEGFEGNGYDWGSLAAVFLTEQMPELANEIGFDPEGSMFCAYSANTAALKQFILAFKAACENEPLIQDLFSRAELD